MTTKRTRSINKQSTLRFDMWILEMRQDNQRIMFEDTLFRLASEIHTLREEIKKLKEGEIMEDVFYFVRQPDHMIECSKYLPKCARIDVIKRRHKIFKTYEEAEKYQVALGVKPLQERQRMNREFQRDGLDEYYGYK